LCLQLRFSYDYQQLKSFLNNIFQHNNIAKIKIGFIFKQ